MKSKEQAVHEIARWCNERVDIRFIPLSERVEQRVFEFALWGVLSIIPQIWSGIPVRSVVISFLYELTYNANEEVRQKALQYGRELANDEITQTLEEGEEDNGSN